jgi:hypothetical protein
MKISKCSCLFLIVFSAAGCSKSVRSPQSALPGVAAPAPGQQTAAPKPQVSLTPIPSPSGSTSPSPSPSPSCSETSTGEALRAKYETAVLRCELQFPREFDYRDIGIECLGSDSFSWDLIKDYADQKKFELNAKSFRKDLIVDLDIQSIDIEEYVNFETEDGSPQLLRNSPVIKGTYSYSSASPISFLKMKSAVSGKGPFSFYEGTDTNLVNEYVGMDQGNLSTEYGVIIDCAFDTKLKTAAPAAATIQE